MAVIERKLMVPMRDGVRMAADLYYPKDASKKYPTIFVRTPYNFNFWDGRLGAPRDMSEVLGGGSGACSRTPPRIATPSATSNTGTSITGCGLIRSVPRPGPRLALTWHTIDRINNRTDRKLLVVDGRIGFTRGRWHCRSMAG